MTTAGVPCLLTEDIVEPHTGKVCAAGFVDQRYEVNGRLHAQDRAIHGEVVIDTCLGRSWVVSLAFSCHRR